MKPIIGSHSDNERWSLWEFTRNTNLPYGYFDKGISIDAVVAGLAILIAAITAIALAIMEGL